MLAVPPALPHPAMTTADDADLLAGYRLACAAKRNPAIDALRPHITAVLRERRGYAARWYPTSGHGTTPVCTVEQAAGLTVDDVLAVAAGVVESGAEPRLALVYDANGQPIGLVIGARRDGIDLTAQRTDADDLLAAYRQADGDGLDEMVAQDAAEQGEAA